MTINPSEVIEARALRHQQAVARVGAVAAVGQAEVAEEMIERAVRREMGRSSSSAGLTSVSLTLTDTTAGFTRSTMSANDAGPAAGCGAISDAGAAAASWKERAFERAHP